MARTVGLVAVTDLLERRAQLVEVLPHEEYEELHLPDAINIPLRTLDAKTAAQLDRSRPVVVYCWDALCDMSPRAATRLGQLGFDVYDYVLGKVDWMAHNLQMEGTAAADPTAGSLARHDVATCALDEVAEQIAPRIEASPYRFALVLAGGVVLGRVRRSRLGDAVNAKTAETLMEPGPSTIRAHTSLSELLHLFQRRDILTAIVTTPEGELIGVVRDPTETQAK
jgi:rhodanese-related sulfurtransferase